MASSSWRPRAMRAAALVTLRVTNSKTAAFALVVEQDAGAGVEPVALPVVDGDVVTEDLGAAIRRAGMKSGQLVLRRLRTLPNISDDDAW